MVRLGQLFYPFLSSSFSPTLIRRVHTLDKDGSIIHRENARALQNVGFCCDTHSLTFKWWVLNKCLIQRWPTIQRFYGHPKWEREREWEWEGDRMGGTRVEECLNGIWSESRFNPTTPLLPGMLTCYLIICWKLIKACADLNVCKRVRSVLFSAFWQWNQTYILASKGTISENDLVAHLF